MREETTIVKIICDICKTKNIHYKHYISGLSISMDVKSNQDNITGYGYNDVCEVCFDKIRGFIEALEAGE